MDYLLFIKAIIIGVSIAAPVGPIGLLCMQRTLISGKSAGFACGMGAASADAIYGAVGAFGLGVVTQLFTSLSTPLALFGGLFLIGLGIQLFKSSTPDKQTNAFTNTHTVRAYLSTFLLTLANPMTILSFIAIFSTLSGNLQLTPSLALTMVLGVFLGSALWWLSLVVIVSLIKHKISAKQLHYISKISGIVLITFGLWQIKNLI